MRRFYLFCSVDIVVANSIVVFSPCCVLPYVLVSVDVVVLTHAASVAHENAPYYCISFALVFLIHFMRARWVELLATVYTGAMLLLQVSATATAKRIAAPSFSLHTHTHTFQCVYVYDVLPRRMNASPLAAIDCFESVAYSALLGAALHTLVLVNKSRASQSKRKAN